MTRAIAIAFALVASWALLAGCANVRDDRVTTFRTTWPVYPPRAWVDRLMAFNPP
jgi:hypothetical protein